MRRPGFWLLVAAVAVLHLLVTNDLLQNRVGWGSGEKPPPRIDVTFVKELEAAAPPEMAPPVAAAPVEKRLPAVAKKPKAAASAASAPSEAPTDKALAETAPEPAANVAEAAPAASTAAELAPPPAAAAGPAAAPASEAQAALPPADAASAQPFDWPPSTRLTYILRGNYRGPVEGTATVEWLRQGTRYQVHLETSAGGILSRHITSDGELTAQGLAPRRFDGEQSVLFRAARRWQLRFGPELVVLPDGREVPTLPGVQDEASQFVQLTWLFTTQPDRLQVGKSVEMPLAISRRVDRWIYDIVGEETLNFPFGAVPTFHIKPRREAQGGDLTAEIWIAPTLQYLPVRILIRDNKDNSVDLSLEKPPLQAAQPPAAR